MLKLNAPVSRELKSGERHFYLIKATEKEFVEIVCERKGVDVALSAFSPTGEKISVSNAPSGFAGRDRLAFVAEKAGAYRIELGSRRPGNIIGNYTILLKDERVANENDLARAEAMKLLGDAREILHGAENRVEKATKALEKLEKAVKLFEKSNDLQGQVNALFQIGNITGNEHGDEKKAVEVYEKALEIWRRIDDDAGRAICLVMAGHEWRDNGDNEKSLAYYNEALLLNKKLNDRMGKAVTLSYLCRLYNNTGVFQKGFETCRESLRLGQNADPLTDYATYSNLAALYENTADAENSLKYYQISLERALLAKDFLNPIRPATAKGNMGIILYRQKKYQEAIDNFKEVIAVSETVNRPLYASYFLAQLSYVYLDLKQFETALEYGEKSLSIYRQFSPNRRQIALSAVGKCYTALGKIDKARETLSESLTIFRERKDRYAEAETLYNLAQLETKVGNTEIALENVRQAISISEILRADLLGKNQRSTYLKILKRYYELNIELLVKLYEKSADAKYLEQAWQNQEKIRARSLLENFLESGFDLNNAELKDFFAKEQNLLETIAAEELKRADAVKTKNRAAQKTAETNLQKALDEYQILQEEIRKKNPRFSALGLPKDFSFTDAQNLLDEETAILEYSLGERQSYVW
ncbi:MAG: tetratricopeptide repeat protein, partial [Acidobacteriota bacterium]|nr:tetratricopeptide repeat protein [Acidobacteriota bacterium]